MSFISVNAKTKEKKLQQIATNINLSNLIDCLFTFQIKIVSWKNNYCLKNVRFFSAGLAVLEV